MSSRLPDKLANIIINTLRDEGILLSTDGPYKNVIKIKPPMPFNKKDWSPFFNVKHLVIKPNSPYFEIGVDDGDLSFSILMHQRYRISFRIC